MNDATARAELEALFAAYERALMENDLDALHGFFWPSPQALRFGDGGASYGIDEIAAFRRGRAGGSPRRVLKDTRIVTFGPDHGVATTEFIREGEARTGRQTQVWVRFPVLGWRIVSAHVSLVATPAGA
ncbi:oxalurate catabolism protein HpxZ [Acidocella sp.]|uniref:oxalurate catabolism protein HpxZ n=1 Tax=Acidocella sp. TaxID=50710 RepID=UPI003CFCF1F4